ncbi:hypothetical protein [Salinigranum halophilum]|jgi:hypothetical protein|uniref:hypothetical protein n=1 Tax=Salinigranum halophilum TaxID=2565931 RepID=UPI0010A8E0A6|nr:hypothetical protein [Salinigranum halophilum]
MSTNPDTTRRTDARTNREELETEAPLCPDLGRNGTDSTARLRRELHAMREQLDRIERRLEADR